MSATKVRTAAASGAAAANNAWTYSERGPIKDPVERINEVKFLAQNPDGIRESIRKGAGALAESAPEMVQALQERAVAQVQHLAMKAPAIYFDRLGRALSPPQGKMRAYLEFENAMNSLQLILKGMGQGTLTRPQAEALKLGWPAVQVKAAAAFFMDPDKLREMSRDKLRVVEMVTGMPLTASSDPLFILRQQQGWIPPEPAQPPAAAQSYSINPEGSPTPSQANATGRAPGNQ